MTQLVSRASDVRVTEINLSSVITSTSVTVAAFPVISKQGSTNPLLFTNAQDWLTEYGNPDPSVSMTIQSGINYFTEGNQAWGLRVVGTGAEYAGVLMYIDTDGSTKLKGQPSDDPINDDLSTFVSPGQEAVALFYPNRGPGSYGDNYSIKITTAAVTAPSGLAGTAQLGSGSMAATTYTYQVSTLSANGESLVSSPVTLVLGGTSVPIASITLTWTAVQGAIGYNVYGRITGGTYGLIATTGAATLTFVDNGVIVPDHTHQPITDAGLVPGSNEFVVSVYDNTQPNLGALENFTCTLNAYVDNSGTQTELDNRINPFSSYIQVSSNVPALPSIPKIGTVAETAMTGGASGTTPTSSQIALAMQIFTNKSLYGTNVFVNCGIADPVYQLAIDTLVQGRGDAVSLLDVPSISQQFQASIDYRNLTLNLNSTYSSLFGPDLLQADLINGMRIYCPPSGWAAALCARTDRVANPAYSIAGLNRGLLNVLKQRYAYDDGEATDLFNAQVNYTRTFVGQGIALWEQQTLAGQYSALSWLSVRRITNVIKVSLYKFLLYSLQEMDTDAVRRQIINSCSQYLDAVVAANGLFSYTVECDNGNNTAATANAGVLVVTVVLVPNIPIHEIQLQVVISRQGVTFSETLSAVNGNTQ
jgi:Phage tail sheath protein subtilisin-like domain